MGIQFDGINNEINSQTKIDFPGSIGIAGTLTYEDVANVDSIGIITARAAVSIADSIIHTGDTNTSLRFPAADTITADTGGLERIRVDSSGKIQFSSATDNILHTSSNSSRLRLFGGSNESVSNGGTLALHGVSHSAGNYTDLSAGTGGHIQFRVGTSEKVRIDSSGRLLLGTTTEGSDAADNFTISDSGDCGITIRSGTNNNGAIHFSDATSGSGENIGSIDYDHANNSMNFYADNDQCLRLLNDKSVSISDKLVLENGTVFLNKHSVGIGTTTQTGRNAGVSTATGTVIYNAETEKVQVYANAVWRNVGSLEPEYGAGYYSSLSAAQTAGLSHYWPGNSSTALISGLQPDDRKGNPTFNNKEHDGYGATNPFFHFAGQTGGDNPTGYRYTHSADWVGHSFAITYWVKVMQEVTEGESTYVQLGNHSGLRSMFAMSSSGNTNLIGKTITIGSDNANDQIQYEFANWIHVGVRYNSVSYTHLTLPTILLV